MSFCRLILNQTRNHIFRETKRHVRTGSNQISEATVITDTDVKNEIVNVENLFERINEKIKLDECGRQFAVVHLYGKQHLIHEGDLLMVRNFVPANNGERIKLEKCLVVGNANFTLFGRPLLDRDLVNVQATVVEKLMSHTIARLYSKKRPHPIHKFRPQRYALTVLRINEISLCHKLNETQTQIQ